MPELRGGAFQPGGVEADFSATASSPAIGVACETPSEAPLYAACKIRWLIPTHRSESGHCRGIWLTINATRRIPGNIDIGADQDILKTSMPTQTVSSNKFHLEWLESRALLSAAANVGHADWISIPSLTIRMAPLHVKQPLPTSPTNLVQESSTSSSVTLQWFDTPTNVSGFRIDRWNGRRWRTLTRVRANIMSYTDTRLKPFKSYAYRIFAYNSAGISEEAAFIGDAFTMPVDAVSAPINLSATIVSPAHTILQFTDIATNELGYNIQVSANGAAGPWLYAGYVPGTSTTGKRVFDYTATPASLAYAFRVAGYTSTRVTDATTPTRATAALSGKGPAILKNGETYTFTFDPASDPNSTYTSITAHRRNADGSIDATYTPQVIVTSFQPTLDELFGLPDGNIAVVTTSQSGSGNSSTSFTTLLNVFDQSGITIIVQTLGVSIGQAPNVTIAVSPDGTFAVATQERDPAALNILLYGLDSNLNPNTFLTAPVFPNAVAELPDGVVAVDYGMYLGFLNFQGYPTGLTTPKSVQASIVGGKIQLNIADQGTNETSLLVVRRLEQNGGNDQQILGTIPSSGKVGSVHFTDTTAIPGNMYHYFVYPVQDTLIGAAQVTDSLVTAP